MIPLYRTDPYLTTCTTVIDRVLSVPEGTAVFCREALFLEGGGQPMDHGSVVADGNEYPLLKIIKEKGNTGYVLPANAQISKGQTVECKLDWQRRLRTMRLHSAQHALAGCLRAIRASILTGGMKIADDVASCSVLYPGTSALSDAELSEALRLLVREIEKDCVIRAESVESEAEAIKRYGTLYRPTVASGNLKGKVRLIVIDGLDANACGGTHVRSLGEVKAAEILAVNETEQGRVVQFAVASSE